MIKLTPGNSEDPHPRKNKRSHRIAEEVWKLGAASLIETRALLASSPAWREVRQIVDRAWTGRARRYDSEDFQSYCTLWDGLCVSKIPLYSAPAPQGTSEALKLGMGLRLAELHTSSNSRVYSAR